MDMHCHHVYTPIVVMLPAHVCLGLTFLNVLIFALTFFNVNNMCLSLTPPLKLEVGLKSQEHPTCRVVVYKYRLQEV
jgi:hypothetical protein